MIPIAWILFVAQLALPAATKAGVGMGSEGAGDAMVVVGPGMYRPLFPPSPSESEIPVPAFRLDRNPVTNGDFLAFVRLHPEWRRDRVPPLFADEHYLDAWKGPGELGPAVDPTHPVVDVSWFAARAYCASRGLRLPTEAQWELALAASHTKADALFEWVLDFDTSALTAGDGDVLQSCAGSAARASGDKTDFAAFERFAMRSALRARYTTHHLGFRCAGPASSGGTS